MKILQVIPYFYPAWSYGGPPRVTYELCKEMVKRGHEITVFTTDALDEWNRIKETPQIVDGIEIRRFRNLNNYIAFHHRIFISLGMINAMRNDIKNYDIVHINEYRTLQGLLVHHYAQKYDVPYVVQAGGSLVNIVTKQRLKSLFDIVGGHTLLRDASRLIAVAPIEFEEYKIQGASEENIEIVPNGIDLAEFENLPSRGIFRQKYGLKENNQIILFLGRLHKRKGIDLLISAFAGITKDFNEARLVIAGSDDGYMSMLKNLVAKLGLEQKVVFTGLLVGEEKLAAYVDASVFALTSFGEVFGVSILEALACGTPVIVTDSCGIADIIKDKAGLVVPYEKEPLTQALCNLLTDEKLRQRLGHNGKAMVWKNYGWTSIAGQMEQVYQKAIVKNKII